MADAYNFEKVKRSKSMSKRTIGRPKIRWEDGVLEDIRIMKVCD
jgi:hypothetical protein